MTVICEPASGEMMEFFRGMCKGIYLDGECFAFAIALHQGLNWQMVGLIVSGEIRHIAVRNPADNGLFDARGSVIEEEFGRPFGAKPPYELRNVGERELYDAQSVQDISVRRARRMAEILWPDFPWENSMKSKIRAFAKDLEKISQKHGLWIRAMVPAFPPLLDEGYGDEGGYVVCPAGDGATYSINRHLNKT